LMDKRDFGSFAPAYHCDPENTCSVMRMSTTRG
jgi:hypothetical protein